MRGVQGRGLGEGVQGRGVDEGCQGRGLDERVQGRGLDEGVREGWIQGPRQDRFAWARGGVVAVAGPSVLPQRPLWGPAVCVAVLWALQRTLDPCLQWAGFPGTNSKSSPRWMDGGRHSLCGDRMAHETSNLQCACALPCRNGEDIFLSLAAYKETGEMPQVVGRVAKVFMPQVRPLLKATSHVIAQPAVRQKIATLCGPHTIKLFTYCSCLFVTHGHWGCNQSFPVL